MNKKIIVLLLVLTIIVTVTVFLFTSNILVFDSMGYKINTECELMLWHLEPFGLVQFTFNEIQSDEFKIKYPDQIRIIESYNEQYISIVDQTKDASDAWKSFPPKVMDSTFEIISNEISINPELKPFVQSMFFGELTDEKGWEVVSNDPTKCSSNVRYILNHR